MEAVGFLKKSGIPYVEAHHVTLVSTGQTGVLSPSNIMTLCANHHRQIHYGRIELRLTDRTFELRVDDGDTLSVPRQKG